MQEENELPSSPSPNTKLDYCLEKHSLVEAFTLCVSEYFRVQAAQVSALIKHDAFDFETELEAARECNVAAKRAVVQHQEEHGC